MVGRHARFALGALVILGLLPLSGCATEVVHNPDVYRIKPKIVLQGGQFRVVRTVRGTASCWSILYIDLPDFLLRSSGISSSPPAVAFLVGDGALRARALEDLHRKHDLVGKPQILHNFVEEWSLANYLGLFAVLRLSLTAEVIEFGGEGR